MQHPPRQRLRSNTLVVSNVEMESLSALDEWKIAKSLTNACRYLMRECRVKIDESGLSSGVFGRMLAHDLSADRGLLSNVFGGF